MSTLYGFVYFSSSINRNITSYTHRVCNYHVELFERFHEFKFINDTQKDLEQTNLKHKIPSLLNAEKEGNKYTSLVIQLRNQVIRF